MALLKSSNFKRIPIILNLTQKRNVTKQMLDTETKKCYNILGISEDSDQVRIRSTYLELVKKYHPDSGSKDADSEKFLKIDKAFRTLINKVSNERWSSEEIDFEMHSKEYEVKHHSAPQHRQYLNFDGLGIGNPFQREKQYGMIKTAHAAENVLNHRISKAQMDPEETNLVEKNPLIHKIKTKYGYERLVEDLITEAMSRGDFDNLSGTGKPLTDHQTTNPYVDFVTQKLNQVLIDNGFTPEWIMLQKDIRVGKERIKEQLIQERTRLGKYPFDETDELRWQRMLEANQVQSEKLNKIIQKYNLLVPILNKQMSMYNLEKEAEKIAKTGQTKVDIDNLERPLRVEARENPENIFSYFESFFFHK